MQSFFGKIHLCKIQKIDETMLLFRPRNNGSRSLFVKALCYAFY